MVREIVRQAPLLYVAGTAVSAFLFLLAAVFLGVNAFSLLLLGILAVLFIFCFTRSVECEFTGEGVIMRSALVRHELQRIPWEKFSRARAEERRNPWGGLGHSIVLEGERKLSIGFETREQMLGAMKFIGEYTGIEADFGEAD